MAEIRPFRGMRYSDAVDLQDVIAPPYDVLSAAQAAELRARSPYNAVHVDLPVDPGDKPQARHYQLAASLLRSWQATGVLRHDDEPALYLVDQIFRGPDGRERTRRGFVARLSLAELSERTVRPHEKTHAAPLTDRLELMRATHANLSQILLLYPDDDGLVAAEVTAAAESVLTSTREARDADENLCRVAPLGGAPALRIAAMLRDRDLYIADGHHRYETALAYRAERLAAGDHDADTLMVYLCSMSDPGLAVFPAHRLVKGIDVPPLESVLDRLQPAFEISAVTHDGDQTAVCERMARDLADRDEPAGVFGLCFARENACCTVKLRDPKALKRLEEEGCSAAAAHLSVTVLHNLILRDAVGLDPRHTESCVDYVTDPATACNLLAGGGYGLGAFLNAPNVAEVRAIADLGETMPQKSTYFYPKLLTGLVFDELGT
jgi:uncharacterized protein (DUF1015 family)